MLNFSKKVPESRLLIHFAEGLLEDPYFYNYLKDIYKRNKVSIDQKTCLQYEIKKNLFGIYRFSDEVNLRILWKTLFFISTSSEEKEKFKNEIYKRYPLLVEACKKQDIDIIHQYSSKFDIYIITLSAIICYLMEQEHGKDTKNWKLEFMKFTDFLEGRSEILDMYYFPTTISKPIPQNFTLFYQASRNWEEFFKIADMCSTVVKVQNTKKELPFLLKSDNSILEPQRNDKIEFSPKINTMPGQIMNKYGVSKVADIVRAQRFIEQAFISAGLDYAYFFKECSKKKESENLLKVCLKIEEQELYDTFHSNISSYLFTLWIQNILKEYKSAKQEAIKLIEAKTIKDVSFEKKLLSLQEENSRLKKEIESLKECKNSLIEDATKEKRSEMNALKFENLSLQKCVNKLKNELKKKSEENKEEITKLREFFFKSEQIYEEDIDIEDSRERLMKAIQGKKIVVFGGPDPFIIKMKGLYKDILFYSGKNKGLDTLAIVRNADFVFIYSNHMVHALYYKIINSCKKTDTEYGYLGYRQNPKYIEEEMLEYLEK